MPFEKGHKTNLNRKSWTNYRANLTKAFYEKNKLKITKVFNNVLSIANAEVDKKVNLKNQLKACELVIKYFYTSISDDLKANSMTVDEAESLVTNALMSNNFTEEEIEEFKEQAAAEKKKAYTTIIAGIVKKRVK